MDEQNMEKMHDFWGDVPIFEGNLYGNLHIFVGVCENISELSIFRRSFLKIP